jgi:ligand-binding sensor domain-containing protein
MKNYLILLLVIGGYAPCIGQVPFFQQYSLVKKSESIQVNTIFQDRDGFIWLGSTSGLFKIDGKNQYRYSTRDSLPDNHITAITQDSLGRIWIGHNTGEISILHNGNIQKFEPAEGTATEPISDMLFDRHGNLWFSTLNDGLYYFTQNRLYRLDEQEGMPDLYIYDIAEDSVGHIIAGTDGGMAVCLLKNKKVSIEVINYKNGLPDNIIKKIVPVKNGKIWLATEDAGILQYDQQSEKFKSLMKEGWHYGSVEDFIIIGDQFWISCPQKGLLVYNHSTSKVKVYDGNQVPGLASTKVLLEDIEGNVWCGTKSGLLRTPGDNLEYIQPIAPALNTNIQAVAIDRKGSLWFANHEGLWKRTIDRLGKLSVEQILRGSPYERYTVISLYIDVEGYVWAGLYGEGVLRINPATGKIHHLTHQLRNGNVLSITGMGNVVWLATLGGASRVVISGEQLAIKNYSTADGLSSDFIYQVFMDSQNRVWFATDGKGVDMLDEKGFHQYAAGFSSPVVYGLAEDAHRKIWANVQDHGLYSFDEYQKIWAPSPIMLRNNTLNSLSSDKSGNIVVMHDYGMDVIDVRHNAIRYFGDEVGLHDKEANLNAVSRDEEGNIFFGTSDGIVKYSASHDDLHLKPKPRIVGVKIGDRPANLEAIAMLKYDENNISLGFLGLWYQNPESVFFQHQLENYDQNWIVTHDREVTYSSLPPGKYVFRLKVSETDDFKNAEETSIAIVIHPPFWRTIPFYFLCSAAVFLLFFAYLKYRERKLYKDKVILEAKIKVRTREVQLQNEEIQVQNEEIFAQAEEIKGINENLEMLVHERTAELERKNKALEEYAFINAHKLRSPVASILGLVNLISKTEMNDEGKEINKRLQQTADELDTIVRSITKTIEQAERDITNNDG